MGAEDCRSRIIKPFQWKKAAKYLGQWVALGDTEEQAIANYDSGTLVKLTQIDSALHFCYGSQLELGCYFIPADKIRCELYLRREEWRVLLDALQKQDILYDAQRRIKTEVLEDDSE